MSEDTRCSIIVCTILAAFAFAGFVGGRLTAPDNDPVEETIVKGKVVNKIFSDVRSRDGKTYCEYQLTFEDREPMNLWIDHNNSVPVYVGHYQEFVSVPVAKEIGNGLQVIRNYCPSIAAQQSAQWQASYRGQMTSYKATIATPSEPVAQIVPSCPAEEEPQGLVVTLMERGGAK
jgi:hypothetical protein